jgi:uncharacterized protein (TIGR00369 family)
MESLHEGSSFEARKSAHLRMTAERSDTPGKMLANAQSIWYDHHHTFAGTAPMDDRAALKVEYGVTPTEVMASMPGLDFVRAIFDGRLPSPPIMQTVEPFDSTAEPGVVVFHSTPGFRHYNPIGSVHGGYAATLLDSAMGLAVHSMLPPGTGYTTLEFKISFVRGMAGDTGVVRSEGRILNVGRRAATAEARITDTKGRLLAHAPRPAWFSRYLRKLQREREPLTSVVSAPDLQAREHCMSVVSEDLEPLAFVFEDHGLVPNNPMPFLVYKGAIDVANTHPEKTIEGLFGANGWGGMWRNGVYDYLHYHATVHEALGIARGHARVRFGGDRGKEFEISAGDVAILPAGTGHQCLSASPDFSVVGAYPPGAKMHVTRPTPENHRKALKTIPEVKLPESDPVMGKDGPLVRLWKRKS